ncbi:CheR family methyltransferase, partial [Aeromonas hydrophila]|uniref:CheR family methyltransferase n=1 Tax=Aeromonas hydrophila TaxID=644 RepID=UPI003F6721F9
DLRDSVEFTHVNLSEVTNTRSYRNFDVIFCRNLLIYFDDLSRSKAAEVFFDALNIGGFVCLGHSESMSRITSLFTVKKYPEAIVNQKPEPK